VIPDPLRIHDRDRSAHADPQTIHLRAIDERQGAGEFQILQPLLEKVPGLQPLFAFATFRLRLVRAQEDVAAEGFQAQFANLELQFGIHPVKMRIRSSGFNVEPEPADRRAGLDERIQGVAGGTWFGGEGHNARIATGVIKGR
jgi:hypothetical protein